MIICWWLNWSFKNLKLQPSFFTVDWFKGISHILMFCSRHSNPLTTVIFHFCHSSYTVLTRNITDLQKGVRVRFWFYKCYCFVYCFTTSENWLSYIIYLNIYQVTHKLLYMSIWSSCAETKNSEIVRPPRARTWSHKVSFGGVVVVIDLGMLRLSLCLVKSDLALLKLDFLIDEINIHICWIWDLHVLKLHLYFSFVSYYYVNSINF